VSESERDRDRERKRERVRERETERERERESKREIVTKIKKYVQRERVLMNPHSCNFCEILDF
jgi:hypothetical protein